MAPVVVSIALVAASPSGAADLSVQLGGSWLHPDVERTPVLEAGAEARLTPRAWGVRPVIGASWVNPGSWYGYVGARRSFRLTPRLDLTPGFAVGYYERAEWGPELGGPVEFRSSLELGWTLPRGRLGLTFYHLSNARIYEKNPGWESLLLSWSVPLRAQSPQTRQAASPRCQTWFRCRKSR